MRKDSSLRNTYVVTETHLNFAFKWNLHFSILVIKLFNNSTKLFKAAIATVTL